MLNRPTLDGNALAAQLHASSTQVREIHRSAGAWGAAVRLDISIRVVDEIARIRGIHAGPKTPHLDGARMADDGWPKRPDDAKGLDEIFANIVECRLGCARPASRSTASQTDVRPLHPSLSGLDQRSKKGRRANPGDLGLKVLAVQTGGRALDPSNDMTSQIDRCIEDAAPYYTLSFDPPPADGPNEYHELRVLVDRPGLTARTRTGYYDDPHSGLEPERALTGIAAGS